MRAGQSHRSCCCRTRRNHQPPGINGRKNTRLFHTLTPENQEKKPTKNYSNKQKTKNIKQFLFQLIICKMWWNILQSWCLWCAWKAQQLLFNSLLLIFKSLLCTAWRGSCVTTAKRIESAGHVNCHGDAACTLGCGEPLFDGQSGVLRFISLWMSWTRTFRHNIQRWAKPWASSH